MRISEVDMHYAYRVTCSTVEIAARLTLRAEELLEQRHGFAPTSDVTAARDCVLENLVAHALVVAGTEQIDMIDLAGEVDFTASEFEELAELVIARAEANLPTNVFVPQERSIPVRRVGVRARSEGERMMEILGTAAHGCLPRGPQPPARLA
jgi:hypothetical protein